MRNIQFTFVILIFLVSHFVLAQNLQVRVAEPFIQIFTGPGVGYPVYLDLERGSWLTVHRQQVDWYEVSTEKGERGWVKYSELKKTETADGELVDLVHVTRNDFEQRDWELGAMWGKVEESSLFTLYTGYAFNSNLSAEFSYSQLIGSLSTSDIYTVSLAAHPFPEWRVSPYFHLGTGMIQTRTRSTLVQEKDKEDRTGTMGFGLRMYLTRSFFLRAEYTEMVIYTSTNDYEELELWSIGVGTFF